MIDWLIDWLIERHFQQYFSISCRSLLPVEETRVPGENHRPDASHWQIYCIEYTSLRAGFELTTLVVIGTGTCKANYHTITTATGKNEDVYNGKGRAIFTHNGPPTITQTIASYEILQAVLLRAKSVLFHRHETLHLPHILNTSTSILFIWCTQLTYASFKVLFPRAGRLKWSYFYALGF